MKIVNLLTDSSFETGFHLLGINPTINHRKIYKHLDYDGKAKYSKIPIWQMAQWWTPYNVLDAKFKIINNNYIYETPSRRIEVNPHKQGYLRMNLSASKEYINGPRLDSSEPWSHLLIEQDFQKHVSLDNLEALRVQLTFNIEKVINQSPETYNPSYHAAQLVWYFVIYDASYEGSKYGNFKEYFWFGVPIYDNRHDFIDEHHHVDQGGIGTTGRLIYSMSNKNYLNEKIKFGQTYDIDINVLPFILKAKTYAIQNEYLKQNEESKYEIGYMNFGWEIPGMFDVESYIQNMNVIATIK